MGHGGTLNKIRNIEALFERAAGVYLLKMHPMDVMRYASLVNTVHDDEYNYSLPADFGILIDLIPDDNRNTWDTAFRLPAGHFDLEKATHNKTISIEGNDGTKYIRINWRTRRGKTLNYMNGVSVNGTWIAVAGATNIKTDTIFKTSGTGSVKFDVNSSGDGIQNTTMTQVDMTNESQVADLFFPFYIKSAADLAKLTSVTAIWGNDLTANFWTGATQTTQYDGSAFKVGWNTIMVPWSTATQTGTVDATKIDSAKLTFATTSQITQIRVDNLIFTIGRPFDMKYYSKFLFKSNSTGTWISRPASDDDFALVDNDSLPHYLFECLQEMAQQMEGTDGQFDITYAQRRLMEIYPAYKGLYPAQNKKPTARYGSRSPGRGRW